MSIIFLSLLTYIAACFFLIARGGGYQYSEPDDKGFIKAHVVFSPMIWLRDRGYFYIRDQLFSGLVLMPVAYWFFTLYFGLSSWFILPLAIGWTIGGLRGWGKTLLQVENLKNFPQAFLRCLHFGGVFFFPLLVSFSITKLLVAFALTVIFASIMPLIYHLFFNMDIGKIKLNYGEFISGAILFILSVTNILL